jgi:O-antigen/teichoic acid export membrane protein
LNSIKKLAGQTAIYGLSSILGRFINYLLVPIYTYHFVPSEYGIVTEIYAYVGFLIVLYTYGMETAFFRFYKKENNDQRVFSTATLSILVSSIVFTMGVILFSQPISSFIKIPNHPEYILWMGLVIAFDAISTIPFAKLRAENRPLKFATLKLINIAVNVGLNLFFIILCPNLLKNPDYQSIHSSILQIYNPQIGIGYIFISNLIASAITILLLFKEIIAIKIGFDSKLWKTMMIYAMPLVIVGFAGIINETLDRILLNFLIIGNTEYIKAQIGIYGAVYKLSILMTLFIQAYRYAAEPFFFSESVKKDAKRTYAVTMKFFVFAGSLIFLGIMLYLDIIKYFIGPDYHSGLNIVPILLLANLFLGIYYNLSIWYKLTDKTLLGSTIAIGGAVITIIFNILLIPVLGFTGSAWTTLLAYFSMTVAAYFMGRRYYPVNYDLKKLSLIILMAIGIWYVSILIENSLQIENTVIKYTIKTGLLFYYLLSIYFLEKRNIKAMFTKGK